MRVKQDDLIFTSIYTSIGSPMHQRSSASCRTWIGSPISIDSSSSCLGINLCVPRWVAPREAPAIHCQYDFRVSTGTCCALSVWKWALYHTRTRVHTHTPAHKNCHDPTKRHLLDRLCSGENQESVKNLLLVLSRQVLLFCRKLLSYIW